MSFIKKNFTLYATTLTLKIGISVDRFFKEYFLKLGLIFINFLIFFESPLYAESRLIVHSIPKVDVAQKWYFKESKHFQLIFPLRLKEVAHLIEIEAEGIFEHLSSWAQYKPSRKIDIIITDNIDRANGFVTLSSRGLYIVIYTMYPYMDFIDGLDAYKNWYRNLLIHELSHILHLDIVDGFPALSKRIFGNIIYPNLTTPLFYKEGFATYSETVTEEGYGRGNYTYTDMYIRTAFLQKNPPLLDRSSSSANIWPFGEARYLYGVSFINYINKMYGEEKIFTFNRENAGYLFFTWGISFKNVYGKEMYKVWQDWINYEEEREKSFVARIEMEGITNFIPIGMEKGYVYSISFNNTGDKAAYCIRPAERLGGLYIYDFKSGSEKCIKKGLYAGNLLFSKDDKRIFYIRSDVMRNVYHKNNIYEFDLIKKREKQITKTGSIQGFTFTEDEDELLICYSTPHGTEIHFIKSDGEIKSIVKPENNIPLVEQPDLSPDKKTVAFSCKDLNGRRGIYLSLLQDLKMGIFRVKKITASPYNAFSPAWLNSEELLFVADKDGIYNIYKLDINTGITERITNVVTGVFDPEVSIDGKIILKKYTSEGYRVVYLKNQYSYEKAFYLSNDQKGESFEIEKKALNTSNNLKEYKPGEWLFPGYWLPFFINDRVNLGLGFYTSGADLLKIHTYSTALLYDVIDSRLKSFINYTYHSYPFSYFISLFAYQNTNSSVFAPYTALFPGISFPIFKRDFLLQTDLGFIFESPYTGVDLSFYFNNIKRPLRWVGPEQGIIFMHEIFYNFEKEMFVIFKDYFSSYFRLFDIFLLNLQVKSSWGVIDEKERVTSGALSDYIYIPLNSIYTMGYPEVINGRFVLDFKTALSAPLFNVYRGIRAIPIFFEGINISLYLDNGIITANSTPYDFVITDLNDFWGDPIRYIRSSVGFELQFGFIIGYEVPLKINLGYVHTLSYGGTDGFYTRIKMDIPL